MYGRLAVLLWAITFVTVSKSADFPSTITKPSDQLEERNFTTQLDHFRTQDGKTIQFRYVMNRQYYNDGGPLLVYINDAMSYTTELIQSGLMYDIAKKLNGALITSDHRYFRTNLPTENASYDNLQYLTIEQALSDISYLIGDATEHLEAPNAKVIVWGTGYGGTLAALARDKYPHLIDGAWSSSGIFALSPVTDATAIHLSTTIGMVDEHCQGRVRDAFDRMEYLIDHDGGTDLQTLLNLCQPLKTESDLDVATFMESTYQYVADYVSDNHRQGIEKFCSGMLTDDEPLAAFAKWKTTVYGDECLNRTYDWDVTLNSNENWGQIGTSLGFRQWFYFKCTQFGMLEVASYSDDSIFGQKLTETYHYYGCADSYGPEYDYEAMYDSVATFDTQFGNRDNYETTNVIFTNGLFDRYYPYALTKLVPNDHSVVINIEDCARSADLTSIAESDSDALRIAKQTVEEWITKFVTEVTPGPKIVE